MQGMKEEDARTRRMSLSNKAMDARVVKAAFCDVRKSLWARGGTDVPRGEERCFLVRGGCPRMVGPEKGEWIVLRWGARWGG